MTETSRQVALDLIYLTRCALLETDPEASRVAAMDLPALFYTARQHSMAAIAWAGLGSRQEHCSTELAKVWEEQAQMALRKAILLDIGREEIFAAFEAKGIWYLPLKGILLQDLYPTPGLREMSDNDIFFDVSRRQEVIAIMQELGYDAELCNLDSHDIYTKPPVYNYEMHLAVMGQEHTPIKWQYYQGFEAKLLPGSGGPCSRQAPEEEFYIHLIAHAHDHYIQGGIGLRILADLYVYLNARGSSLDWDYIANGLSRMEIQDFDRQLRQITQRVFDAPQELTAEDWRVLDYCQRSGTYGNDETLASNKMRALQDGDGPITLKTKLRYIWRRIWPDQLTCQLVFPFFARYPFLKPFLVIYRIFRLLFFKKGLLKAEMQAVSGSSK